MRKWYHLFPVLNSLIRPFMPAYVGEGGGGDPPPVLPDGFSIDALQGDAWANIVNERFKDDTVALNTKSPLDAVEQLRNAQKLLGKKRLPEPQDDWKKEDWDAFYNGLGRPAKAEEYKLGEVPEKFKDKISPEFMKEASTMLHEAGLTGKQYEKAMGAYFGWLDKATAAKEAADVEAFSAAETALKKELGAEYEAKVNLANNLIRTFADAETSEFLATSGLGNNPGVIRMMMKIADQFKDDDAIGASINSNLSGENQAKKEIADMKGDPDFQKRLFDETHAGHRQAVQKWHDAHKKAYPGSQTK